jgi:hypothetical protein
LETRPPSVGGVADDGNRTAGGGGTPTGADAVQNRRHWSLVDVGGIPAAAQRSDGVDQQQDATRCPNRSMPGVTAGAVPSRRNVRVWRCVAVNTGAGVGDLCIGIWSEGKRR